MGEDTTKLNLLYTTFWSLEARECGWKTSKQDPCVRHHARSWKYERSLFEQVSHFRHDARSWKYEEKVTKQTSHFRHPTTWSGLQKPPRQKAHQIQAASQEAYDGETQDDLHRRGASNSAQDSCTRHGPSWRRFHDTGTVDQRGTSRRGHCARVGSFRGHR